MVATFIVHLLHQNKFSVEITKVSFWKTAYLHVHLIFNLYMHWLVGRGPQLVLKYRKMLIQKILLFLTTSTILQMLGFHCAKNSFSHTMVYDIILLSGAMLVPGMNWFDPSTNPFMYTLITGLQQRKNYFTFDIPQHTMSLSKFSGFLSVTSEYYLLAQSIIWRYKHEFQ